MHALSLHSTRAMSRLKISGVPIIYLAQIDSLCDPAALPVPKLNNSNEQYSKHNGNNKYGCIMCGPLQMFTDTYKILLRVMYT